MKSKTIIGVLCLLIITYVVSVTSNQCKVLDANAELRAQEFFEQSISDLQPIASSTGQTKISKHIQLIQGETFDVKALTTNPRQTQVVRTNLFARKASNILSSKFFKTLQPGDKKLINALNPYALVWAISNVVNVEYDKQQALRVPDDNEESFKISLIGVDGKAGATVHLTVGLTASALLVPNIAHSNFSDISFLFYDASSSEITSMNLTFGSIAFAYPFEPNTEVIYNVNGAEVGHQPTGVEQTAVNVVQDVTSVVHSSQDDTIRIRVVSARVLNEVVAESSGPSFSIDFFTVITTQGSTKLIRYTAITEGASVKSLTATVKTVLIPKVNSGDNYDFVANGNLGAKIEFDKNGRIIATANLNQRQQKAFEAQHGVTLQWPARIESCAILIVINPATGSVEFAENLSAKFTTGPQNTFASGLDIKGNFVIVSGNNINVPRGAEPTADLVSFVSRINLSGATPSIISINLEKANLAGSSASPKNRFVAHSALFSITPDVSDNGNTFTVGGHIINYENAYAQDGRLILVELNNHTATPSPDQYTNLDDTLNFLEQEGMRVLPTTTGDLYNILYSLQVGYSMSNSVNILKRSVVKIPIDDTRYRVVEDFLLGCKFDGPTTAPPKSKVKALKFRSVHSGVWQVDCDAPNKKIEVAFSAVFFSVFGVNTFFFILVIILSSLRCVWEYKQAADEEKRLIMEGVY